MTKNFAESPIGIFDSGVGGLSVLKAIRAQLPDEEVLYLGDQGHVPYGPRPLDEVRGFSEEITRFLLAGGAKLIIVACNSASAAALPALRENFPQVSFVGMEPAIKPAAELTRSGVIGVLATPATFQGTLYASALERYGQGVTVLESTVPGLVTQIEKGQMEARKTEAILREALLPMLDKGADTVVLGCTHYAFVIPLIRRIVGPDVNIIDPAPAIARRTVRLLQEEQLRRPAQDKAPVTYYTTGAARELDELLPKLVGEEGEVKGLCWKEGKLGSAQ